MDTTGTVEAIHDMAKRLREYADDFDRIAQRMDDTGDLSYAGQIAGGTANLMQALRLDLLVTRPLRAFLTSQ